MSDITHLPVLAKLFAVTVVLILVAELAYIAYASNLWMGVGVLLVSAGLITLFFYRLYIPVHQEAARLKEKLRTLQISLTRKGGIFTHTPDGMLVVNRRGKIVEANAAIHQMLGYEAKVLEGMHVDMLIPLELRKSHQEYMRAFFEDPRLRPMHHFPEGLPVVQADGSMLIADITLIPLEEQGEVALLVRDLSRERALKRELKQKADQYRAFAQLTQAFAFGLLCKQGRIEKQWVTPSVHTVLGEQPEEWLSRPLMTGGRLEEHEKQRLAYLLEQLQRPEETWQERILEDVFQVQTAQGTEIYLRVSMRAERQGEGVYIIGAAQDITEEYRQRQELASALEVQEVLLSTMSHEVRTPLTAIMGFASILKDEVPDEELREFIAHIETAGERLLTLLTSLLHLAQIRQHEFEGEEETVHAVAQVVRQYIKDMDPLPVRLNGPENLHVRMHAEALHGIIKHLLDNAYKFTSEGAISVSWYREGDRNLCIEVSDTGVGIHPDFIPHMLKPFTQESRGDRRLYEGAGLGLALVSEFVTLYKGDITVESEKGQGSTFRVWIPDVVAPGVHVQKEEPGKTCTSSPKVLVIEDNPTICRLVEKALDTEYQVQTVCRISDALNRLKHEAYHLFLLDIHFGGDNPYGGLTLLRTIRNDTRLGHIPVIAMTAYGETQSKRLFTEEGFDAFLAKPFSVRQLKECVSTWTGRAHSIAG